MALPFSVIACAHNEAGYLGTCLHSLQAQSRPPDEVLVVNNASDAAATPARRRCPPGDPRQGALSIACHAHHRTTRRIEISTCYLWDHRDELADRADALPQRIVGGMTRSLSELE